MDPSSEISLLENGETLRGRWTINGRIGGGGFGQIYEAFDEVNREFVAVKVEPRNASKPVLRMEVVVLKRLHGSPYSCSYLGCGRTDNINYLVMQMQGKNLSELRRAQPAQKFSVSTSLRLVYEALHCIEAVHAEGFLHRDVKPSNFAIGASSATSRKVFILDFGLARHFIDSQGRLRSPRSSVGFRGTVRYASLNAHREKELGRHDDLISLFYMAVEFLFGSLPWKRLKDKSRVAALKKQYTANCLLGGKFPELESIYNYLEQLNYHTKPNYENVRKALCRCILNNKVRFDDPFDWEQQDQQSSYSSSYFESTDGGVGEGRARGFDSHGNEGKLTNYREPTPSERMLIDENPLNDAE
ncbi:tau-tubulin kinase 2 [Galendromus occidentalis]|uniref:Tau-tubulin kinase 2 n=1 Tax=Galendromus occidentalis TaxID=34638 RepID=A0AAJ7L669_9ACAR|nr:tau-tubulin kinase 2 [Galendromus occidentalis]